MRLLDTGRAFHLAWRLMRRVPGPVARALFALVADITWARRTAGVRRLEANLSRVRPEAGRRELRRLSRRGMRSYMRYYVEAFRLPAASREQIRARVRLVNAEALEPDRSAGRSVVAALGHMGNWDLAGAFAGSYLMPVLTVAERLEPESLFQEFLKFRQDLGMRILALGDDGVFSALMRGARTGGALVCLLADRDLTAKGLEVELFGERARVAAGPAALCVATGAQLVAVTISYEKLVGERRRAARWPWGLVVEFTRIDPPGGDLPRSEAVRYYTQAWVDVFARGVEQHPQDWHMLQKVFVSDLDPQRYARTVGVKEDSQT